jgi:ABC-type transport system substrate-binding protein
MSSLIRSRGIAVFAITFGLVTPWMSGVAGAGEHKVKDKDLACVQPGERAIIVAQHFTVAGTTEDFGHYLALGEATFGAGNEAGVLPDATGIAVVQAENGDQIVADVTITQSGDRLDFTFHWRDSVTFSDGTTVSNTGAFVNQRPPGLVVNRTVQTTGLRVSDPNECVCVSCNCRIEYIQTRFGRIPVWTCDICCCFYQPPP